MSPLSPGSTIGILGGGQLGRMLALAAARLGLRVHIYAPPGDAPAVDVAAAATRAGYDDMDALQAFAAQIDAATTEFENVPAAAAAILAARVPMRPSAQALKIAQDRLTEKRFLNDAGAQTADYIAIDSLDDLRRARTAFGGSGVLKTRRLGYDGKGQARVTRDCADHWDSAWRAVAGDAAQAALILERMVPFEREVSVIVARGSDGATACYDPAENIHENGILRESRIPAAIAPDTAAAAQATAARIAGALDYVGVMGVEMFVVGDSLLVNEIAPRVHNTGHWTQNACAVDQFEQHIRAVAGWPLGDGARHADAVMRNLLGDEALDWESRPLAPGAALHLYGKAEARSGRKMGHMTTATPFPLGDA